MFLTHFARKNSGLIRHLQTRWLSSKIVEVDGALVVKYSPAPGARLAPTPLVFVGSSQLEDDSGNFHLYAVLRNHVFSVLSMSNKLKG